MEYPREEILIRIVRTPGTGLGISIAGGYGSVPYEDDDEVNFDEGPGSIRATRTSHVVFHLFDQIGRFITTGLLSSQAFFCSDLTISLVKATQVAALLRFVDTRQPH